MTLFHTFPTFEQLSAAEDRWPVFMHPNRIPYVIYMEDALKESACESIISAFDSSPSYTSDHCGATTREIIGMHPALNFVKSLAEVMNRESFKYDVHWHRYATWLQSYEAGGDYAVHMDGSPGQNRKVTAVVQLSDPDAYEGGALQFMIDPNIYTAPRTQGTLVLFPSWLRHRVLPIDLGLRQTINMGFWGPPFR